MAPPSIVVRPAVLPIPVCPTLTPIPASAFVPIPEKMRVGLFAHVTMAISNQTYSTLATREGALRTCARTRKAVIEANNRAAAKPAKAGNP